MDTLQTIKDILEENLNIDPASVAAESTLESLGIDSLDIVELICDLEARCDVEIGYPDNLETLGDIVALVESLRA